MTVITNNSQETKKLGQELAKNVKKGDIICLSGNLGSGKTTFTQGFLRGLKIKGPYTSPTFVVLKEYKLTKEKVYHIDAYRVNAKDILNLGWEEIVKDKSCIIIIEWADRIKKIIPVRVIWVKFKWLDKNKRQIIINDKQHARNKKNNS